MGQQPSSEPLGNQQQEAEGPQVAWWCRLLGRVVGAIGGVVAIITGIFVLISIHFMCILAGIIMMIAGVIVLIFEVPICCTFIEITKPIAAFAERRTFFQKAIIFGVLAIIPVAMCFGITSLFGCLPMFAAGVLYGLMALGKKADREEMMARAAPMQDTPITPQATTLSMTGNLIKNEVQENPFNAPR
ncbi:hypothetical protein NP493_1047g00002 [Ridgeia piscesae]|uniref:Calcium channel flower n=1 Tax=Ridgeia piscesae TaxID=27915 RepID=A0AAD9KI17_RIDPI|nr:hypothetical protein NP493_1047g00002 [Ridgeia piscesae]